MDALYHKPVWNDGQTTLLPDYIDEYAYHHSCFDGDGADDSGGGGLGGDEGLGADPGALGGTGSEGYGVDEGMGTGPGQDMDAPGEMDDTFDPGYGWGMTQEQAGDAYGSQGIGWGDVVTALGRTVLGSVVPGAGLASMLMGHYTDPLSPQEQAEFDASKDAATESGGGRNAPEPTSIAQRPVLREFLEQAGTVEDDKHAGHIDLGGNRHRYPENDTHAWHNVRTLQDLLVNS